MQEMQQQQQLQLAQQAMQSGMADPQNLQMRHK